MTTYFVIILLMPPLIRLFRRRGLTSDFKAVTPGRRSPYVGAKPIMGGGLLILAILVSTLLWAQINQFVVALLVIMLAFGSIGAWDDLSKVRNRRLIEAGGQQKKDYSDKADGVSGRFRLGLEILVALVVVLGLYRLVDIDGHLVVPFIPLDWWYPYLPREVFIPFMVLIIVAGANAVNLTDGMDSLATVPIITCTLFVAGAIYISSDADLAQRLRLPQLSLELRELEIVAAAILSAGLAFLRFNSPPAMITMGDLGALALGSLFSTMFIFAKTELFLPIVGGVFVLTTLSSILQRVFFKVMLALRGRESAERIRFFYRAPYHHHLQALWAYSETPRQIVSVWVESLKKLGINPPPIEDQLTRSEEVNSRVIWRYHMLSIWLLVLALVVYFKVR